MPVVTISRQFGAGGHTLGEVVAKRLGYQFVDRDIIYQVAKEANVSVEWIESMEKEAGGLLMRFINKMISSDFIERLVGNSGGDLDEEKYIQFVKQVVKDIAAEGDAIIIGRGGQFIIPDNERTIKVLLVAEIEDRIKFMMDHYDLTRAKAEQLIKKEEKRRQAFLKLFDPRDPDDSSLYSLVINTSRINMTEAEQLIVDLIGRIVDEYARPIW